ncbi:MAG: N-acetylmuramoyl-L-alanine amidase, partial [Azoarcus sp.]|nr:N-acetylmuramoyl-L-alanine amidase [Azoarcus sp.]
MHNATRGQDETGVGDPARPRRRALLKHLGSAFALLAVRPALAAPGDNNLVALRVWPADEYSRITFESSQKPGFKYILLKDPDRFVLDLEEVDLKSVLVNLFGKVLDNDPYIKLIRAAQNRPGVVRIVVELKTGVNPQVFTIIPVGGYQHRLVVDLYPTTPIDPLLALIQKSSPMDAAAQGDRPDDVPVAAPEVPGGQSSPALLDVPGELPGSKSASGTVGGKPASPPGRGKNAAATRRDPPKVNRLFTLAIDPGHGGEDPGAVGGRGTYEKTVTLSIARRLKRKIDATPGMRAMLTRDSDYFVPLAQRVMLARRVQADLFVSIHADAAVRAAARGSSVFVLSEKGASSSAARMLAQKENEADLIGGVNLARKDSHLARTLLDLSQAATINDSIKLGRAVLAALGNINDLHKPHIEQAGFA